MSLQDELDALRAEFVRSAPPGRAALYDAKVDELRRRDRSDSSQTTQGVASRCGTGSSNPALSSRQSVSLPQPLLKVENPAFRAGLGSWLADRVSRDSLGVSISRQPAAISLSGDIPGPG